MEDMALHLGIDFNQLDFDEIHDEDFEKYVF